MNQAMLDWLRRTERPEASVRLDEPSKTMLTRSNKGRKDNLWQYLPGLERSYATLIPASFRPRSTTIMQSELFRPTSEEL